MYELSGRDCLKSRPVSNYQVNTNRILWCMRVIRASLPEKMGYINLSGKIDMIINGYKLNDKKGRLLMKNLIAISVFFIVILGGCAATVPPVEMPMVETLQPQKAKSPKSQIYLSDFSINLPSVNFGQAKTGTLCVGGTDLQWTGHPPTLVAIQEAVKSALLEYEYELSSSLIKEKAKGNAEILIAGSVTDMKGNLCLSVKGQKGDLYAEVSWELYNKKTEESLSLKTQGFSSSIEFSQAGDSALMAEAVKVATANMLSDPRVYSLLNSL